VGPFEKLTRENVESHVVRELARPKWRDALVRLVELDGRHAILKDVHGRNPLFRFTFGRRALARELRIYKLLDGIPGVPRALGMLDRDGLLIEYVDGSYVKRKRVRSGEVEVPADLYDRCLAILDAIHERGVFHLDLRNRKNFVIDDAGGVHVVDFVSAAFVPRWLPFRGAVERLLDAVDRSGVLKMKRLLTPERMTEEETLFLERFERRRLILFPPFLVINWLRRRGRRSRPAASGGRDEAGPDEKPVA